MVAHIWGDKPEQFKEMSFGLADMGFKGIDLNMGCPVANVAKKVKGLLIYDQKEQLKLFKQPRQVDYLLVLKHV